jgi:hypothetical protein
MKDKEENKERIERLKRAIEISEKHLKELEKEKEQVKWNLELFKKNLGELDEN